MGSENDSLPDWERLLAAETHLQHLVPGAVLVGGTAAAIHAGHRMSMDADHILEDLRNRLPKSASAWRGRSPTTWPISTWPATGASGHRGMTGITLSRRAAAGLRRWRGSRWRMDREQECS